jgi:hypothetical protein
MSRPHPNRHPKAVPRKPEGQPTRGKTARNRLRRVDAFVARYDPALVRRSDGPFARAWAVDLGYGAKPFTTLEMAARLRKLNPALPVLGVEIEPERVAAALPFADDLTSFRLGGFNLPLHGGSGDAPAGRDERARLIRAFNVLRQYGEAEVAPAWSRLGRYLLPGGLLVEGTSNPPGRLWVANVLRKPEQGDVDAPLQHEALVFSTSFHTEFDPGAFQPALPKNLIHRIIPGEAIHRFFADWKRAAEVTSPMRAWGQRQWFGAAARELARLGWAVNLRAGWLRRGYLIVRDSAQLT